MTTKPKPDGWNHRSGLEDKIADINTAIAEQQDLLLLTNQRDAYSQAVATTAKNMIKRLERDRADLIRERNTRR